MSVAVRESVTQKGAFGRLFDAGGECLDVAVVATWRALAVRGNSRCLVCGETFERSDEGGARCAACGSRLE